MRVCVSQNAGEATTPPDHPIIIHTQAVIDTHHALATGTLALTDLGLTHNAGVVISHAATSRAGDDIPPHHTTLVARASHAPSPHTILQDPFNTSSLLPAIPDARKGRENKRTTFAAQVAYHGDAYAGWQWQPGVDNTVQRVIQQGLSKKLQPRLGEKTLVVAGTKAKLKKKYRKIKGMVVEGGEEGKEEGSDGACQGADGEIGEIGEIGEGDEIRVSVAGRTDRGVHACAQVCVGGV